MDRPEPMEALAPLEAARIAALLLDEAGRTLAATTAAQGLSLPDHVQAALRQTSAQLPSGVLVVFPPRGEPSPVDAIRAQYGLTSAETQVLTALSKGISRVDIAAARGVSVGTVRHQIKTIYSKLGVNRQPELFALIASFRA